MTIASRVLKSLLFFLFSMLILPSAGFTASAWAAILYANPMADHGSGSAWFSESGTLVAQPFELALAVRVAGLRFYSSFDPLQLMPVRVEWRIYANSDQSAGAVAEDAGQTEAQVDAAGSAHGPGKRIAGGSSTADGLSSTPFLLTALGEPTTPTDFEARFDLPLLDLALAAGQYWLALHVDDALGQQGGIRWLPASLPHGGVSQGAVSHDDGASWRLAAGALAFQIEGRAALPVDGGNPAPVPEPATMLLLALGLLALALQVLRRQACRRPNRARSKCHACWHKM